MKKLLLLICFSLSSIAFAQMGSDNFNTAQTVGLAGTFTSNVRGLSAININPANTLLEKGKTEFNFVLPLPTITATVRNGFLNINEYTKYFTGEDGNSSVGKYLDDVAKQDLSELYKEGNTIRTGASINYLSVLVTAGKKIGTFGFAISDNIAARANLPKSLTDLFLYGNKVGETYDLNDMKFESWHLRNYTFSYARNFEKPFKGFLKNLRAGVSFKIVTGFFYTKLNHINTTVSTLEDRRFQFNNNYEFSVFTSEDFGVKHEFEDDNVSDESSISPFPKGAGSGVGFDLGLAAEVTDYLTVGFALTDMGSITWDKKAVKYTGGGEYILDDITEEDNMDSLQTVFEENGEYRGSFTSNLPTALRLGVSMRMDKYFKGMAPMTIAMDYNQGFNDRPGNSTKARFSLGCEFLPIDWLPLRSGFSFGGEYGFNWSFGLGFIINNNFELDMATYNIVDFMAPNRAEGLGFAFSSKFML